MTSGLFVRTDEPVPVIDTHVHFYDPTRPQGTPWPPRDLAVLYKPHLPMDFRKATSGLGIAGVIVVEASDWLEDNQWILDLAKDEPLIVGFVGNLDPAQPGLREKSIKRNSCEFNPYFR